MMDTKITALNPKVMQALSATLNEAKARKLNVALHCGLRPPEEQDKLFNQGLTGPKVTNSRAWESPHQYGLAVDVVFKDAHGWTWDKKPEEWEELGKVGEMFGFSWGGRWKSFKDYPHFEMWGKIPDIVGKRKVDVAKDILFTEGVDKLWSYI